MDWFNSLDNSGQNYYEDDDDVDQLHDVANVVSEIFATNGLAGNTTDFTGAVTNPAGGSLMSSGGTGLTGAGNGSTLGTTFSSSGIPQVLVSGSDSKSSADSTEKVGESGDFLDFEIDAGTQPIPEFGIPNVNTTTNTGSGYGDIDWAALGEAGLGLIAGNVDRIQSEQDSEWWGKQLDTLDGMYKPGTPEATLMQKEMEAKDAAAGRRSQYGVRSTDLAAQLATKRAGIMTSPGYQNMANAYRGRNAQANNGLAAAAGNAGGSKPKSKTWQTAGAAVGTIWGPVGTAVGGWLGSLFD